MTKGGEEQTLRAAEGGREKSSLRQLRNDGGAQITTRFFALEKKQKLQRRVYR